MNVEQKILTIRLDEQTRDLLAALAHEDGRSMTKQLRHLIREASADRKKKRG